MSQNTDIDTQIETAIENSANGIELSGTVIPHRWLDLIVRETSIGPEMQKAVLLQGKSENRAKPIGLYCGDIDLVRRFDPVFNRGGPANNHELTGEHLAEKTRISLIESFEWFACEAHGGPQLSTVEIIDDVSSILRSAQVPLPNGVATDEELRDYVEKRLSGSESRW